MAVNQIDPDGVIAMSAGVLAASLSVGQIAGEIRTQIDKIDHLVGGAPQVGVRGDRQAEKLATLAGFAKDHALKYVDDIEPLTRLKEMGYWLPDLSNLGWDRDQTVTDNIDRIARSDEFGALPMGTAGMLMDRYRNFRLHVPKVDQVTSNADVARLVRLVEQAPDDIVNGRPLIRRASGLLVPQGGSADPRIPRMSQLGDDAMYRRGPSLVTDPGLGRPPAWARYGSRGLFVAGAALTIYDSGVSQWEHDQKYHPEWSTGQRVASTSLNVATEGGGAIAGGYVGAQIGATLGSFVPIPVVGTLGGALIGGAIGAFVGSKAGKAVGSALREGGEAVVDGAKKLWNSVFG